MKIYNIRERGGRGSKRSCCQDYLSITITSAHNLPPRLREPGRGLARGPGARRTRTAHTHRAVTSPPQTTTQKAHPHLGPILIWRKGTLVPGPALSPSNFNPAPRDASHVASN